MPRELPLPILSEAELPFKVALEEVVEDPHWWLLLRLAEEEPLRGDDRHLLDQERLEPPVAEYELLPTQ